VAELQKALRQVVLHKVDAEKGEGIELAARYRVQGYPTFELVDAGGASIARWMGYERAETIGHIERALADPIPIAERRARFESTPTSRDAAALAAFHKERGEFVQAVADLRAAQRLVDDPRLDYRYTLFETLALGTRAGVMPVAELQAAADAVLSFSGHTAEQTVKVARTMLALGRYQGTPELAARYLGDAVRETAGRSDGPIGAARRELLVEHALVVERDSTRAVQLKKASMRDGWMRHAESLNHFAWWCFENRLNLEEAESFARKGVELADAGREKANLLDTLAEICSAQGRNQEAVRHIELAMKESPEWVYLPRQLERFRKELGGEQTQQ